MNCVCERGSQIRYLCAQEESYERIDVSANASADMYAWMSILQADDNGYMSPRLSAVVISEYDAVAYPRIADLYVHLFMYVP